MTTMTYCLLSSGPSSRPSISSPVGQAAAACFCNCSNYAAAPAPPPSRLLGASSLLSAAAAGPCRQYKASGTARLFIPAVPKSIAPFQQADTLYEMVDQPKKPMMQTTFSVVAASMHPTRGQRHALTPCEHDKHCCCQHLLSLK
jgi:hypothetical protein